LKFNLPTVAVSDLALAGDDLVVGTIGRAAWIFDDLTPLRQMTSGIEGSSVHLFPPRPAMRWRYAASPSGSSEGAAANPPEGALISYYLAEVPAEDYSIEILDSAGAVIRSLESELPVLPFGPDDPDWRPGRKSEPDLEKKSGILRAHWDLTYQGAAEIMDAKIDIGSPGTGPLALPGDYIVRLRVGGETLTAPLRVEPDPRSATTLADMQEQLTFQLEIRERMTEIAQMVSTIRSIRDQLAGRDELLGGRADTIELLDSGKSIVASLDAIEEALHNPHAEVAYDILAGRHGGAQLYSRYSWLNEAAREHDGPRPRGGPGSPAERPG
jgi:hypothetical protein